MLNSFFMNSVKKVSNKLEITPSPPAASQINEAQSSGASPTWPAGVQNTLKILDSPGKSPRGLCVSDFLPAFHLNDMYFVYDQFRPKLVRTAVV